MKPGLRLGLVCGMRSELAALGALARDPRLGILITGARPAKASEAARKLLAAGCGGLVSWGIAGGLDPALAPGALLVGGSATDGQEDWPLAGITGPRLLGSDTAVASPAEKARLHRATGAAAVDMETHRLAAAGAVAGIPVHALRAVADPAGRALPALALDALTEDGRPRLGAVLRGLARRPGDLPALLRLKRDSDAALASLRREGAERLRALLED